MRIQEKISSIVRSQLPEHIGISYPQFVRFIEVYYEFLEQDQGAFEIIQNAQSYLDIDRTTEPFIQYFLNNYAYDIKNLSSLDKGILVKRIKDLYESKGSTLSFQLLFRILYDEDVEIRYPYENVLKPSDGIWDQKISLHLLKSFGGVDLFDIRTAVYKKDGIVYEFVVERAKELESNYCEIFLETKYNIIPFELGGLIQVYDGNTVIFQGQIVPTTTSYSIVSSGLGFKAGQIFTINLGNAVDTLVKINTVDSNGGITSLTFINYGYGYDNEFIIELWNNLDFAVRTSLFKTNTSGFAEHLVIEVYADANSSGKYFASDYVRRYRQDAVLPYSNPKDGSDAYVDNPYEFNDIASNNYSEYNLTYIDHLQDYVADQLEIYEYDFPFIGGDSDGILGTDVAVINFKLGTKAKYPGQYISYRGFVSEFDVRIQDDQLYQPFAYQIQTNLDINVFYSTVKSLIHQAGLNMFSNRTLSSVIDLSQNIDVGLVSNINIELHDTIDVDDYLEKTTSTNIHNEEDNASLDDEINISLLRTIDDEVSVDDNISSVVYRTSEDEVSVSDSVEVILNVILEDGVSTVDNISSFTSRNINDAINVADNLSTLGSANEESSVSTSDTFEAHRILSLYDNVITNDNISFGSTNFVSDNVLFDENINIQMSKVFSDVGSVSDSVSVSFYININDTVSVTDNVILFNSQNVYFVDSITTDDSLQIYLNDYVSETYFANLYVGNLVN